jgi:hypothetical protein
MSQLVATVSEKALWRAVKCAIEWAERKQISFSTPFFDSGLVFATAITASS